MCEATTTCSIAGKPIVPSSGAAALAPGREIPAANAAPPHPADPRSPQLTQWQQFSPEQRQQRLETNRRWRATHRNELAQYEVLYSARATRGAKRQFRKLWGQSTRQAGLTVITLQDFIAPIYAIEDRWGRIIRKEILDPVEEAHRLRGGKISRRKRR